MQRVKLSIKGLACGHRYVGSCLLLSLFFSSLRKQPFLLALSQIMFDTTSSF